MERSRHPSGWRFSFRPGDTHVRHPLVISLVALLLSCNAADQGAVDASAPLREASLLANERFWPYQVALQSDGSVGVLIRVEPGGNARIDFGRDGLRYVPIADTDLVERANRVRSGALDKPAPNFVLAIGSRLVDSSGPKLAPYSFETVAQMAGFLCVFADPSAASFAEVAGALAPLRERQGVATILFPLGPISDAVVRERLQALGWTVPFVYDHLSEAYSRTLLPDTLTPPAVLLQTSEGRVLLASAWHADVTAKLVSALEVAFPAATASAPAAAPL
jgi:hypothetical protein